MGKLFNSLKRKKNKIKKLYRQMKRRLKRGYFRKKKYVWYYENCPVEDKVILLESQHGKSFGGNIFAIAKELSENAEYKDYAIWLSCVRKQVKNRRKFLKRYGMEHIQVVSTGDKEYFKLLATAKYLVNDNTFIYIFIKRPEQVYLNTWHGTPLKTLGKKMQKDYGTIGNAQRNFLCADYLLYPNEFTMQHMLEDYMVENLGSSEILLAGYPRNTAFFDDARRAELRRECGFDGMEVFAYLPTWRGTVGDVTSEEQNERLQFYLRELDAKLKENQRIFVKLHPISSKAIDLAQFKRVRPFPSAWETYEFLNATDGLVTDYSSVFFDYAVSGRKVVLFTYDKEEYTAERGFYFPLEELPFPQTDTVDGLLACLNAPKSYDDTEFLKKFCAYEHKDITKAIVKKLMTGKDSLLIKKRTVPDNGKKNVIIYAGGFSKNGITASIINLLHNLDTTKHNYIILYRIAELKKHQESLLELPEGVSHFGFYNANSVPFSDAIKCKLWSKLHLFSYEKVAPILKRAALNDSRRIFHGCRVDKLIQFNGYVNEMILLFEAMPCSKSIYAHNDMVQEIKTKGNVNKEVLSHAYQTYNSVAVVTPDLKKPTEEIAAFWKEDGLSGKANIVVAKNVINYKRVLELGKQEFALDEKTSMNIEEERLQEILSEKAVKFITIGRFSQEKGHFRLLHAFETFYKEHPDTYLFIVGGYGPLFAETVERAAAMKCADHIVVIKYLSNPFALLRQCDYFVLSSFYEGFGLVLAEADILGLPCFSTDITGPKLFMEQYGGKLVESSEEGILSGLRDCMEGNVPKGLSVDYEVYNQEAVAQFEALIEN